MSITGEEIKQTSLYKIFSNEDSQVFQKFIGTPNQKTNLNIMRLATILIGKETGKLNETALKIISDRQIIQSILNGNFDMNRLYKLLEIELKIKKGENVSLEERINMDYVTHEEILKMIDSFKIKEEEYKSKINSLNEIIKNLTDQKLLSNNTEYKFVTNDEYSVIHNSEMEIFNQFRPFFEYIIDDHGDIAFDENVIPLEGKENEFTPINVSETNLFQEFKGKSNLVDITVIDNYDDVFEIDDMFLEGNYTVKLLAYFEDGIYQGSVWCTIIDKYIVIYGIKSSLLNMRTGKRGIATKLLNFLESNLSGKELLVLNPLESMIPLLTRRGYTMKNDYEEKFLDDIIDYPHGYTYYSKD